MRPAQEADLHRPTPTERELSRSLCLKTTRCLRKDFTPAYQGQLYQIHDTVRATHVQVEAHLDGTRRITHHGRPLGFQAIAARPVAVAVATPTPQPRASRPVTPKPNHPWRKRLRPEGTTHAAAAIT